MLSCFILLISLYFTNINLDPNGLQYLHTELICAGSLSSLSTLFDLVSFRHLPVVNCSAHHTQHGHVNVLTFWLSVVLFVAVILAGVTVTKSAANSCRVEGSARVQIIFLYDPDSFCTL